MPVKNYATVKVTIHKGQLHCDPDWVHLYWEDAPTDIRWAFSGVPKDAVGAVVEFLAEVPAKAPSPPTTSKFRPRGVHGGLGHAPASAGSHLPDIVTSSNTGGPGYFYYDVRLLDSAGKVIAQADPGGENDPGPGPH